jgi:adenylate cyclase
MRSLEEINVDIVRARASGDTELLARCASELDVYNTPDSRAAANHARGVICVIRNEFSVALEHLNRALEHYEMIRDSLSIARVTCSVGNVYATTGDHAVAMECFRRAMSLSEEVGDRRGVAVTKGNIGNIFFQTGDYPAALACFFDALSLHEEHGDHNGVARMFGSIGAVHDALTEYHTALEHFRRSLELYDSLGNRRSVAHITGKFGITCLNMGDHVAAHEYFLRAKQLYVELDDRHGIAFITSKLVAAYLDAGAFDEARTEHLSIESTQVDDPILLCAIYYNRVELQAHSGDLDGAVATLDLALAASKAHGLRAHTAETHRMLRELALRRHDLTGYVEHNNEFIRITEEINGRETAAKLAMQAKQREIDAREREHAQHLAVLHATLPKHVAERVVRGETINDHFTDAAVLFIDIVGFTEHTSSMDTADVVALLERVFTTIDAICDRHNVVKIKTIGDSYMCFRGDADAATNAQSVANVGLDVTKQAFTWPNEAPLQFRVGVHVGDATAGVIGTQRLQYDVWGDTVNVASRLEGASEPGRIHVSEAFATVLRSVSDPAPYTLTPRGMVEIKGKGAMQTHWLAKAMR